MLGLESWALWTVAAALFLFIVWLGGSFLRGIVRVRPKERIEPEEVAELDVYFVCRECGTELQVTRLGEVQVPRHCGEPMVVIRKPRPQARTPAPGG
ncbi:MAG: hypothetical protein H0W27_06600 [Actinobacteria bacterium]|nr:hypothetical protein [Actinomycetota bacterium]